MDVRLWHGPSANKERHGDTADSPTLPKAISRIVSGGSGALLVVSRSYPRARCWCVWRGSSRSSEAEAQPYQRFGCRHAEYRQDPYLPES
jgi:hypothetical protein